MKVIGIRIALTLWMFARFIPAPADFRSGRRTDPVGARDHRERGDVPGWVMITLMSAVLVAALLALAGPALEALFNQAMDKVGK